MPPKQPRKPLTEEYKRKVKEERSKPENKKRRNDLERANEARKKAAAQKDGWKTVSHAKQGGAPRAFGPPGSGLLGKLVAKPSSPTGPAKGTNYAGPSDKINQIFKKGTPPPATPPEFRVSPLPSPPRVSPPRLVPRTYQCSCRKTYPSQREADNCRNTNHGQYRY